MVAVFLPSQGLALPTPSLIPHGRATAPVGVGSRLREPRGERVHRRAAVVPATRRPGRCTHRTPPVAGPGGSWGAGPPSGALQPPAPRCGMVLVRQDGSQGRGQARGMAEGRARTRPPASIWSRRWTDVSSWIRFHLPAHAGQVGHLSGNVRGGPWVRQTPDLGGVWTATRRSGPCSTCSARASMHRQGAGRTPESTRLA